ncbi:DNA breaking-rejoining protein [Pararhizobium arenae]|uniref:DNA breaking-rejoining protein n=1 Tax=Pararhizobium arenae TaxID=1856850 RepID=UPI000ABC9646|nr:DNA breaking-rejoining protein [Pararhizobium arenae]
MTTIRSLILSFALLAAMPAVADELRQESIRFAPGTSSSTIKAFVKGYQSVQYAVSVTAGQKMSVQLDSRNSSLYFNVTAPGADAAMYNSSIDGNGTTITIPSSGKYLIDVYLMRNAARRNESANYDLTLYVE